MSLCVNVIYLTLLLKVSIFQGEISKALICVHIAKVKLFVMSNETPADIIHFHTWLELFSIRVGAFLRSAANSSPDDSRVCSELTRPRDGNDCVFHSISRSWPL